MVMTMEFWNNFSTIAFFLWSLTGSHVLAGLVDECDSSTNAIIHSSKPDLATYAKTDSSNDGYFSWILSQLSHYDNSIFIPSTSNPCEGIGFHWKISADESIRIAAAFHIDQTIEGELIEKGGWGGVGFSETGGMRGADVVYFRSLTSSLVDAHVRDDLAKPMADKQQDWKLINERVTEDGYLIFEASRPLNTEDDYDRPFVNDSPTYIEDHRLIAAWGNSPDVTYHFSSVVRTSVQLFDSLENDVSPGLDYSGFHAEMDRRSFRKADLLLKPYNIPVVDTTYHDECFSYEDAKKAGLFTDSSGMLTDFSTIIGYEFLIDPGSVKYLHHIVFYGHVHYDGCNYKDKNKAPIFVWTPGEEFTYFPESVGVKFGGENGFKSFTMGYHFDNKDLDRGKMDKGSGLRLFLSNEGIKTELGMMQIGDPLVGLSGQEVGDGITSHSFLCPSTCSNTFKRKKITIVRQSFHMHENGKRIVNELIRNNTVVQENSIDYWDFSQSGTPAPQQKPFKMFRGDEFRTTCYFKTNPGTKFGIASSDEMCMIFILYFPKQKMSTCKVDKGDNSCSSSYLGSEKFDNLISIGRKFANLELLEEAKPEDETTTPPSEEVGKEIEVSEFAQPCTEEFVEVGLGSSIKLRYKFNDTTLTVEMKTPKKAWLALGFNQDGLMLDSDAVIGSLSQGVAKYRLENTKSRSGVNKVQEERQTLTQESFVQDEDGTIMTFTKLLRDGNETAISVKGETTFIYALGYNNVLERGHSESGSIRLSFCSTDSGGDSSSANNSANKFRRIVVLHIFFAVLPFVLMMPTAIAASRFRYYFICMTKMKKGKALWFVVHMFFHCSSYLCVLIGVIFAVIGKNMRRSAHFQSAHEIIGMIVLILLTAQMIGGILRPKKPNGSTEVDSDAIIIHEELGEVTIYENSSEDTIDENTITCRDKWRQFHKVGGFSVLFLGIFNCILGIFRYKAINI